MFFPTKLASAIAISGILATPVAALPQASSTVGANWERIEFENDPIYDSEDEGLSCYFLGLPTRYRTGTALAYDNLVSATAHVTDNCYGEALVSLWADNLYYETYEYDTQGTGGCGQYSGSTDIDWNSDSYINLFAADSAGYYYGMIEVASTASALNSGEQILQFHKATGTKTLGSVVVSYKGVGFELPVSTGQELGEYKMGKASWHGVHPDTCAEFFTVSHRTEAATEAWANGGQVFLHMDGTVETSFTLEDCPE